MLEQLASEEKVDMRVVAHRVGEVRQRDSEGRQNLYALGSLSPCRFCYLRVLMKDLGMLCWKPFTFVSGFNQSIFDFRSGY